MPPCRFCHGEWDAEHRCTARQLVDKNDPQSAVTERQALCGFDISVFVDSIDWGAAIASTAARFAFIECVRGIEPGDYFNEVWKSRGVTLVCGPYQRIISTASGKEHAEVFIQTVTTAGYLSTDLPPVLDVEPDPNGNSAEPAVYIALMNDWTLAIQNRLHRRPIIYTDPSFWAYLGEPAQFGGFPLWIAHTNVPNPHVPHPWTHYDFWQYQQEVHIGGVSKPVDLDLFNGEATALEAVIESSLVA